MWIKRQGYNRKSGANKKSKVWNELRVEVKVKSSCGNWESRIRSKSRIKSRFENLGQIESRGKNRELKVNQELGIRSSHGSWELGVRGDGFCHLDVSSTESPRKYYKVEWFPELGAWKTHASECVIFPYSRNEVDMLPTPWRMQIWVPNWK
jgi:hypothetical protein